MIEASKVNLIWAALELGTERLEAKGMARVSTSSAVDFIVGEAVVALAGQATREEVLEGWVYRFLHERLAACGVEPLPPRAG